jgi:amidase
MALAEYSNFDGLALADLVAKREVKPSELVEEAIARIEKHNAKVNAVIFKIYDRARETAKRLEALPKEQRGTLHGVPFLLKDVSGNYEGVPTTSASRFLKDVIATHDDTLVARFKAAGLVTLGKTNSPEFGLLPTTEPLLYGPSCNPWNLEHSTGGSSGGSAAAVASGMVPVAHANDIGGSIRIPASCCGLVGLKPTRARNPMGPDIGDFASGFVHEHVVTRTVRDSAVVLDCTHGPEPGDPYAAPPVSRPFLEETRTPPGRLRIAFAVTTPMGTSVHPECATAVKDTAKVLDDLGHIVEEASPPMDTEMLWRSFFAVFTAAHATMVDGMAFLYGKTPKEDDFEPLTWAVYEQGKTVTASQYLMSVAMVQMIARQSARFHETYDCWITPTLATPPIKNGVVDVRERDMMKAMAPLVEYVPFTGIMNATGQPAMSLPLHRSAAGLPVGVMLTGRFGDEATLFRLAAQLEQAKPWRDSHPEIWG